MTPVNGVRVDSFIPHGTSLTVPFQTRRLSSSTFIVILTFLVLVALSGQVSLCFNEERVANGHSSPDRSLVAGRYRGTRRSCDCCGATQCRLCTYDRIRRGRWPERRRGRPFPQPARPLALGRYPKRPLPALRGRTTQLHHRSDGRLPAASPGCIFVAEKPGRRSVDQMTTTTSGWATLFPIP